MDNFNRGDVWLAKWAKNTLDGRIEARPAIIASNAGYNAENDEVICLHLTTNTKHEYALSLNDNDFEKNLMVDKSAVRFDIIARHSKNSLVKKLAVLKKSKLEQAVAKTIGLIK